MAEEVRWNELLDQAEKAGFSGELLPPGDYEVLVASAEKKQTAGGKHKITVRLQVTSAGPQQGKKIFNDFVLTTGNPNAMAMFFRQMTAFGITREFFAANPSLDQVASALVSKRARVTLGHREWNGRAQHDIKSIAPVPAAAANGAGPVQGVVIPPPSGAGGAPSPYAPPAAPPAPAPAPVTVPGSDSGAPPPMPPF